MKVERLSRDALTPGAIEGRILCQDLREDGSRGFGKGTVLSATDAEPLLRLPWRELHLLHLAPGDVHETEAGARLARAAAGTGLTIGEPSGGHLPLVAVTRGVLDVARDELERMNAVDGVCIYTLWDGQVVDAGETVARAKIAPFAIPDSHLLRAEAFARECGGVVRLRSFPSTRVGAVVQESLGEKAMARFREVLGEKVAWFGSTLLEPAFVAADAQTVADAMTAAIARGARVLTVAGTKSMDPLDPAFDALERLGARIERHGVPAHPGSLFWLAYVGDLPVLGMPTCGVFSQATVFDLVLPRVLAGEQLTAGALAGLGHGGLLTRDMAFRFPAYRSRTRRGELEES